MKILIRISKVSFFVAVVGVLVLQADYKNNADYNQTNNIKELIK